MKRVIISICYLFVCFFQTEGISAGAFDNLQPIQITTGMQFTECPQWHPDGYLVFSDVNGDKIYKWSETKGLSVWIQNAGNPNGIACSKRNELYVCRQGYTI